MGLFWSNSWSLALIFCTHAKKNPTLTWTLSIKIRFFLKKLPDHFSKTHIKLSIWILYFFKTLIFFIFLIISLSSPTTIIIHSFSFSKDKQRNNKKLFLHKYNKL